MNWSAFFSMDGRAFYVWGSFGAFAVAIALEIVLVRARARRAAREIRDDMVETAMTGQPNGHTP